MPNMTDNQLPGRINALAEKAFHYAEKMHRSDIKGDIADLWHVFTTDRADSLKDYFRQAKYKRAYLGYYLPVYAAKIALILKRSQDEGLIEIDPSGEISMVDIGAGPLTATFGAMLAFQKIDHSTAIDRSESPMRSGRELIREIYPDFKSLKLVSANLFSATRNALHSSPNLAIMAHVLNELAQRESDIERLAEWIARVTSGLAPEGRFLIVEPATRVATRNLMKIRDLLKESGDVEILAPCTGAELCPLLMERGNWCHSEIPWARPKIIAQLDAHLGLDHRSLQYSYLLLGRKPVEGLNEKLRVVSGPMLANEISRRYVCTKDGLLTIAQNQNVGKAAGQLLRGQLIDKKWLTTNHVRLTKEGSRE